MDLTKQFPDISMEVREKFRLYKKLYPNFTSDSLPPYETDKYLTNSSGQASKRLGKLALVIVASALLIYLAILNAPDIF
jgi:hypothetical protein